jgi:16S rRNA (guanine527-N7)-methyltransferase
MKTESSEQIISSGAEEMGVVLTTAAITAFGLYYNYLMDRCRSINLTAITGAQDVARLHFLDSLALLKAARFEGMSVIDIGSGGGFPGIPLKLAETSISLTLLDASGKRIGFLSDLRAILGFDAVCICARAEEASRRPEMREKYDIAISRGVARLNILCELCLPFVREGGLFIAMKSINSDDEITEASAAIKKLGAKLHTRFDYAIPGTDIIHRAVIILRTSDTPDRYPRRFARIQKAPL